MKLLVVVLCCFIFSLSFLFGCSTPPVDPPLIILDTDISSDVDDVGAVAVLHSLANQEKAEILAMMVSSGDPWGVACLDAINSWYGRPDIPLGMIKGRSVLHQSKYTQKIADEFPHDSLTGSATQDAVRLYRKILAEQEDNSVIIVTVGYLTNLYNLLTSKADAQCPVDGETLVRNKVKVLVCMGGEYPKGREWNFYQDSLSANYVVENWPVPIIFSGFEIGKSVLTGALLEKAPSGNPIRRSYELYNKLTDRPSWDQVAVLNAVGIANKNKSTLWSQHYGTNVVAELGENVWHNGSSQHSKHSYLVQKTDTQTIADLIESHMLSTPQ